MARGVDLLIRHCTAPEERSPARARVAGVLGERLTSLLIRALAPRAAAQRGGGGRRGSSSP